MLKALAGSVLCLSALLFGGGCTTKTEVVALQPQVRRTVVVTPKRTETVRVKKTIPTPAQMEVVNAYDQ